MLLAAAVAAGVPRFIPSDFASDFTKLPSGLNRNFDLRREFKERLDKAPILATSILNGAFAELLTYGIPLLDWNRQQVGYWEDADWKLDFTTLDDTAAFTAAVALDPAPPRLLRIASFQISANELASLAGETGDYSFAMVRLGSRAELATLIEQTRAANPAGEHDLYADWQQMQYMLSMFTVQNNPLDNNRYPDLQWTAAHRLLQGHTHNPADAQLQDAYADEVLIKQFPGFTNHYTTVNGVRLHYVEGGSGKPVLCLPGWPQTWYSFHPIAGELAQKCRVIILDIRGMGSSDKPDSGYDKRTMARDVYELVQQLGLTKVTLLGHDIGGMVAVSFAFNYPQATEKLIILDGLHPSEGMRQMSLLPAAGSFTGKMNGKNPYMWWMAFNQVKALPEKLLAGRFEHLLDWLFEYVMIDAAKMPAFDRAVYASIYNKTEAIRAATAWYQAFTQDIEDAKTYSLLPMPVLGIGSCVAYDTMKMGVPYIAKDAQVVGIFDSGHYMFEEKPAAVLEAVLAFLEE